MATPYETVYNRFLQKCTDYDLPKLPDDELESMLHGWMTIAIVRFFQSNSDLSQRDDELRTFLVDLEDYEKEVYEKTIADINAKTSIIQQEDRTLELRLKQLDTEQNALKTEMDAVKKVIKDNVEKTFKTFSD